MFIKYSFFIWTMNCNRYRLQQYQETTSWEWKDCTLMIPLVVKLLSMKRNWASQRDSWQYSYSWTNLFICRVKLVKIMYHNNIICYINASLVMWTNLIFKLIIISANNFYFCISTVHFRAIPINTELGAFGRSIDVYVLDPNRRIMKRWLSRQVSSF